MGMVFSVDLACRTFTNESVQCTEKQDNHNNPSDPVSSPHPLLINMILLNGSVEINTHQLRFQRQGAMHQSVAER